MEVPVPNCPFMSEYRFIPRWPNEFSTLEIVFNMPVICFWWGRAGHVRFEPWIERISFLQRRLSSTLNCYHHLDNNAILKSLNGAKPRPPDAFGFVTISQATHEIPVELLFPPHRNSVFLPQEYQLFFVGLCKVRSNKLEVLQGLI